MLPAVNIISGQEVDKCFKYIIIDKKLNITQAVCPQKVIITLNAQPFQLIHSVCNFQIGILHIYITFI